MGVARVPAAEFLLEDFLDLSGWAAALGRAVPPKKWIEILESEDEMAGFGGLF